jgi:hypothetical protein
LYGACAPIVNDGFKREHGDRLLTRKNDSSLGDISAASWTSCGSAQDVFRGFGIASGKFIENAIEGDFRTVTALVATTDHALCCSSQILTNQMDCHFFQWRIEILGTNRIFKGVDVISESDQRIVLDDTETGRAFHRFRKHGFRGNSFRGGLIQKFFEWRYCETVAFFAGNQPNLRF